MACGILLAPGRSRGRQRFSIAHELGHYHIPTHRRKPTSWCGNDDMIALPGFGKGDEWEANDFATELLMPRRLFAEDARARDASFESILELASPARYDVSVTAAALRFVELTRETCALICTENRTIKWVSKSEAFGHRIPWCNDELPPGSLAQCIVNGEEPNPIPEPVDPYVWLETEQRVLPGLLESTLSIASQDQVLSLIWVVPGQSDHES